MQKLTPLELAVQSISVLSLPVHSTLSSHILPVPSPKLSPLNAPIQYILCTVEPLYKGKVGDGSFVPCPLLRGNKMYYPYGKWDYTACEVVLFTDGPFSEVPETLLYIPAEVSLSCLQTTPASVSFHIWSHTVPHSSLRQISTRPSV